MAEVVVFGSATMDFTFTTSAFPRPGDQVEGQVSVRPGGKGLYQAIACRRLRSLTTFIGSLGTDDFGTTIKQDLQREGVTTLVEEHVSSILDDNFSTGIVGIVSAPGVRTSYIACRRQDRSMARFIQDNAQGVIASCNALLVSFDTEREALETLIGLARTAQKAVIVNASPPTTLPLTILNGVHWVVATRDEAMTWLKLTGHYPEEMLRDISIPEIGQTLLSFGPQKVILTQEDEGCTVIDRTGARTYDAFTSNMMKIGFTGARSAFCAGLTVAYAEHIGDHAKASEHTLIDFASAARFFSRLSVVGTAGMPQRANVDAFLSSSHVNLISSTEF